MNVYIATSQDDGSEDDDDPALYFKQVSDVRISCFSLFVLCLGLTLANRDRCSSLWSTARTRKTWQSLRKSCSNACLSASLASLPTTSIHQTGWLFVGNERKKKC